jgi:hypothetical protein
MTFRRMDPYGGCIRCSNRPPPFRFPRRRKAPRQTGPRWRERRSPAHQGSTPLRWRSVMKSAISRNISAPTPNRNRTPCPRCRKNPDTKGHTTAPIPQIKFTKLSAAARLCGWRWETRRFVVGVFKPIPSPFTKRKSRPRCQFAVLSPAMPIAIRLAPPARQRVAPTRATARSEAMVPRSCPRYCTHTYAAWASFRYQRSFSHCRTGPSMVVATPVSAKPA